MTLRGHTCAWALAAVAFAVPNSAMAQNQCPVVRSIISGEFRQLEGVGVTINGNGLSDLTKYGTAGIIRDAKDCSISADDDGFDVDCNWSFSGGQESAAERAFLRLKDKLDTCLPSPLGRHRPRVYSDEELQETSREYGENFAKYLKNTQNLEDYRLGIETAYDDEIDIELKMSRAKDTGRTWITLNFYR